MKKIALTILWMVAFYIIGRVIFDVSMHFILPSSDSPKISLLLVAWITSLLPLLALILGILGRLPGTQSRKDLVQK
jgi:hypothetical protein